MYTEISVHFETMKQPQKRGERGPFRLPAPLTVTCSDIFKLEELL